MQQLSRRRGEAERGKKRNTHSLLTLLLLGGLLGQLGLQVALLARRNSGHGRGRSSLLRRLVGGRGVPVVLYCVKKVKDGRMSAG